MRTVAIVQARMTSTRLPGKVLLDLGGMPVLEWVVQRLSRAVTIQEVVVATTTNATDDAIAVFCSSRGTRCVRGPEQDVLERFRLAAVAAAADVIVRVTSDCPLVDPSIVDRVVRALDAAADYASNTLRRTWPRGLDCEAFTFSSLLRATAEAKSDAAREHVTWYFHAERPSEFQMRSVEGIDSHADLRWTLDTEDDLSMLRALVAAVGTEAAVSGYETFFDTLKKNPSIAMLNAHVVQKT